MVCPHAYAAPAQSPTWKEAVPVSILPAAPSGLGRVLTKHKGHRLDMAREGLGRRAQGGEQRPA